MNYRIWANIRVMHEYTGGKCSDFMFLPDPASKETMNREGILMSEISGGFYLIAQETAFSEETSLIFWAYPTRQDLWSATSFNKASKEEIPFAKAAGETLQWETLTEEDLPKAMRMPKPMFGVEIRHPIGAPGANVTLSFKTKKMKWRYNIAGLSENGTFEIAGVKTNKENCMFDACTQPSGIRVFTSKQEIPLRYGAAPQFQLREMKTAKAIIKCLPNMDARSIASAILEGNKEETIAETFINT